MLVATLMATTLTSVEIPETPPATFPFVLDDIVITARRYEEPLMNSPLSITVLDGEEIHGLGFRSSTDIAAQVPNLQMNSGFVSSVPTIFMRGVGINDFNANANGAVGIYVDDVYLSSASAQVFQLFDMERIEVLRGPQGTLYGRNTTGGAIHYVTQKPEPILNGYTRLGYGRFDAVTVDAAVNSPLSDTAAMRLSFSSTDRDGITKNRFTGGEVNDTDRWGGRALLRLFPNDELDLLLNVHGGQNRSTARYSESQGLIGGADLLGYVDDRDPFSGAYNRVGGEAVDLVGTSLTLKLDRPAYTVTSIVAYERHDRLAEEDSDSSPNQLLEVDFGDRGWQLSEEIRFASNDDGPFHWVAGIYHLEERLRLENTYDVARAFRPLTGFNPAAGVFFARQKFIQDVESLGTFGQVGYNLLEHTRVTVGARYTAESVTFDTRSAYEEPGVTLPFLTVSDAVDFDSLSGRVGIDCDLTDDVLAYAGISRGFTSGGFNGGFARTPAEVAPFDEETAISYEAGLKWRGLDSRLRVQSALFYNDYSDLQVFTLQNTGGIPVQVRDNAADATTYGAEIEATVQPVPAFAMKWGIGILQSRYDRFQSGANNFSDNELVSAPQANLNGLVRYRVVVGDLGEVEMQADATYNEDQFFDTANRRRLAQDAYWLFNARVSFAKRNSAYEIALWAKNLTDEEYLVDAFDLSDFGFDQLDYGDPRTYGVELTLRF